MSRLEEIRAKLEEQQNANDSERETQEVTDLEALYDARVEHGTAAVIAVRMPFEPGLPMHAIARRPSQIEFKRFQVMSTKKDQRGNEAGSAEATAAVEQLAGACLVYPPPTIFEQMLAKVPGLKVALGNAAVGLATAKAREDAKQ